MIAYHGTPITPTEALIALENKNFFVSFWRPDQVGLVADIAETFIIDNGAFSAYEHNEKVDWEKYKDFLHKWWRPNMAGYIIPDVIGGTWQENQKLIEMWQCGNHGLKRAIPVWHMAEPLEFLEELVEYFETVAIGGHVGVYGDVGSNTWWQRMDEAMWTACDDDGYPQCRLHGLRLLDPALRAIPMASADSTNIGRNLNQSGMSKRTAAIMLAERMDGPAAQRWVGIPRQQNLFEYQQRYNPSPEANAWRL